uniref:Uncharacterized protein n=1 Tax=Ovis aries TaxID=9940 RepID=A0AC11DWZ7_SHEEP
MSSSGLSPKSHAEVNMFSGRCADLLSSSSVLEFHRHGSKGIFPTLGSSPCLSPLTGVFHACIKSHSCLVKNLPVIQQTWVQSLGQEDPLEKRMATHSSILAWRILWTEEPGGLQSMASQRVGHD